MEEMNKKVINGYRLSEFLHRWLNLSLEGVEEERHFKNK